MNYKRKFFHLSLLLVFTVSSIFADEPSKPKMAKDEVIKHARTICKKIEVELKSKPQTLNYSDNVDVLGAIPWEPRWELKFSEANVVISDQNGDLTHFISHEPYTDISKLAPEESEIPESGLAQKAIYFAKILKIPEIAFSKYSMVRGGLVNGALEPKVIFFWKRRFQNIEYLNQHFSLTLDSYSGRALGFGRVFLCPPPIPQSEQISALQASKIAVDFLRSRKLEFQPNSNLLKRVVNDGVWGDGLKHHTTVKPGVVAWTMRFTLSERKYAEVYVDVHSGHIVGSDIVGSR